MKVLESQPFGFNPAIHVCGVLMQHDQHFLLLKRHPKKSHGNHWNLPAGKREKGESSFDAALREVKEESGISLNQQSVHFLGTLYVVCKDLQFEFHLYFSHLNDRPDLNLGLEETIEGKWWNWNDQIQPLIPGGEQVLSFCKKQIEKLNLF